MKTLSFVLCIALVLLAGCNYYMPNPPSPPPPSARPHTTMTYSMTEPTVPPVIPECDEVLALPDVVDLALQNSPKTRMAWYKAKQAATDVGTARGAYLPPLTLTGSWLKEQFPEVDLGIPFLTRQKIMGAVLSTSYLIFDYGGRNGNLMSALAGLESVNWAYNWEVQTVMIGAIQSYYNYINAWAIVEADRATVEDNLTTVEAATHLRETGVKGLGDELQARTSLIQSQIILEQDIGILNVAKATLVQSLGLPPDTPLCFADLPEKIEVGGVCQDMASLMQIAKENRADLMAVRSAVVESRFKIRSAKSALLPTITTQAATGKESLQGLRYVDMFELQFNLNVPLFNQFTDINNLRKAQAALLEAQADLDNVELNAFLSVLSDYYELLANTQILNFSGDYLEIAVKNREVAFANYKVGITTVIDLMTANNALNTARIQLADAKTNFLTSVANLAYDTGGLDTAIPIAWSEDETDLSCDPVDPDDGM